MTYIRILSLLILAIAAFSMVSCDDFRSDAYQKLSAKEKQDKLWEKITADTTSLSWYSSFKLLKIFVESMDPTFEEMGDVMPDGRLKLIHTVGNIAKAEFIVDNDHPYTGIFKGSQHMFLRFSIAKQADFSKTSAQEALGNFIPGISLKFFVDGKPSSNLMAMFSTHGQPSWDPFKNDFSNTFPVPDDSATSELLLAAKFKSRTPWISSLGVRDMASYDESGNFYSEPVYPYKLVFRPSAAVKGLFPDTFKQTYIKQLKTIPAGTILYEVYAVDEPGCNEHRLGYIKITTELITSKFADESLFFRHGIIENDDKSRPEWTEFRDTFAIWGGISHGTQPKPKSGCPFGSLFN